MGCVASRLEQEEEVVSICRERKHQLKLAVESRYALADSHYRYCKSLYGVSAALNLFVARHSAPPSPFYITLPPPPSPPPKEHAVVSANPLFLQQTPSQPTKETVVCEPCTTSTASSVSFVQKNEKKRQEKVICCDYLYMDTAHATLPSPQRDFGGWDFFNPFTSVTRPEMVSVYGRISEDDLKAVREQEGIPDLEDDDEAEIIDDERKNLLEKEKVGSVEEQKENVVEVVEDMNIADMSLEEQVHSGLAVTDSPVRGRELLEALRDIEDHFIRAYDSGKDVCRMLECNRVHLQSNLEEFKENSAKLIQSVTWRSPSSRSLSCKSLVASSSKSSSTWSESTNDLFDEYGGMVSGCHSLTLARLYAWEKKLYEEVKDGDSIRILYERKCNQLRNQDARGGERLNADKTRAAVKDLYSRILVAIRTAETISNQIEKLRDEELEPQIRELLKGMAITWKIMLESHEIQNKIMFEVKSFTCPSYGKFCNESHRLATLQLQIELLNWRDCFIEYVAAQKEYISALYGWLSKFVAPEVELYSKRGRSSSSLSPLNRANGPPLLMVCYDWLDLLNKLPDKSASFAIKSCVKDVRALWLQQGEEQHQKRKVDSMSKELDRKVSAFQKSENRFLEFRLTENKMELDNHNHRAECMSESKNMLDNFRRRLDLEKEEHQKCMQETERITLNGLQTGFSRVFEAMTEFSREASKMYNGLSTLENREKLGKPSLTVGDQQFGENNGR